jgi:hypothetical protein
MVLAAASAMTAFPPLERLVRALASEAEEEDPLGGMPQAQLGFFQEHQDACNPFGGSSDRYADLVCKPSTDPHVWGLLLPVCCRAPQGGEACFEELELLADSILRTLPERGDRELIRVYVAVDQFDVYYDCEATRERVAALFTARVGASKVVWHVLRSHYRGKLCRIWDDLARSAVEDGCCFMLLVGDDVRFLSPGWKREVEAQFEQVATRTGLPFGTACVAFRDDTFPVFPTFPVVHSSHLRLFGGLLPPAFVNQHGDPFLFELYRKLGASEFAPLARLINKVGGADTARYDKHQFDWAPALAAAAAKLTAGHAARAPLTCVNVVVPSFRCDTEALRRITTLAAPAGVSLHVLVVVDNPAAPNRSELEAQLSDWSPNHLVRVSLNSHNLGAPASRNAGLACSTGADWVLFLDDDVVPDRALLEAYHGAMLRSPRAHVLVGCTLLPEPETLAQRALEASQMTFFYDVARRMPQPAWGVTANLCVRAPAKLWFNEDYPRTGGGEDVDFCLRLKDMLPASERPDALVAVPEAVAVHPYWRDISRQVVGWALGDVRCLDALPGHTFWAPPNWAEFLLLAALTASTALGMASLQLGSGGVGGEVACTVSVASWLSSLALHVALVEVLLIAAAVPNRLSVDLPVHHRATVALASAWPIMAQDAARLASKLVRLRLSHVCLQLDWLDGQRDHVGATRTALSLKCAAYLALAVALSPRGSPVLDATWPLGPLLLCAFVVLWRASNNYGPAQEAESFARTLEPLPASFAEPARQPFVVLAYQRTGSNLLCGRLHNHHDVVMHNEVFNAARAWTYLDEDVRADPEWRWDIFSRDADPLEFLLGLFGRKSKKKPRARAVGFKLFPDHWTKDNAHALRRLVADVRVKKILLRRDDLLAVYASKLRADKTGSYLRIPLDDTPLAIDLAAFAAFVRSYPATYDYLESCLAGQHVHRVSYDRLADSDSTVGDEVMLGVLRFLGVTDGYIPPALPVTVKQTTRPLEHGITNYAQVKAAFQHHPRTAHIFRRHADAHDEVSRHAPPA